MENKSKWWSMNNKYLNEEIEIKCHYPFSTQREMKCSSLRERKERCTVYIFWNTEYYVLFCIDTKHMVLFRRSMTFWALFGKSSRNTGGWNEMWNILLWEIERKIVPCIVLEYGILRVILYRYKTWGITSSFSNLFGTFLESPRGVANNHLLKNDLNYCPSKWRFRPRITKWWDKNLDWQEMKNSDFVGSRKTFEIETDNLLFTLCST